MTSSRYYGSIGKGHHYTEGDGVSDGNKYESLRMSKKPAGLSSRWTSWNERRFLKENVAERDKTALSTWTAFCVTLKSLFLSFEQQKPLTGFNQGSHIFIFVF